jgi:hypothetical protein
MEEGESEYWTGNVASPTPPPHPDSSADPTFPVQYSDSPSSILSKFLLQLRVGLVSSKAGKHY